jgi:hypothetical protein
MKTDRIILRRDGAADEEVDIPRTATGEKYSVVGRQIQKDHDPTNEWWYRQSPESELFDLRGFGSRSNPPRELYYQLPH